MFVEFKCSQSWNTALLHSVCPVLQSREVCKSKTMQWRPWIQAIEWLFLNSQWNRVPQSRVHPPPSLSAAWCGVWQKATMRHQVRKCEILDCPVTLCINNFKHSRFSLLSWRVCRMFQVNSGWDLCSDRPQITWSGPGGPGSCCSYICHSGTRVRCNVNHFSNVL